MCLLYRPAVRPPAHSGGNWPHAGICPPRRPAARHMAGALRADERRVVARRLSGRAHPQGNRCGGDRRLPTHIRRTHMTEQTVPVPFAFLVDVVDPVVDEKHLPLDVHAKPLLLIDDHQAEVAEVDVGPGQAMGADRVWPRPRRRVSGRRHARGSQGPSRRRVFCVAAGVPPRHLEHATPPAVAGGNRRLTGIARGVC